MQGFFLGLSSSSICVATCAPVLIPYLLGEGKNSGKNALLLGKFLSGRLIGYLIFAVLAWLTNWILLNKESIYSAVIYASAYVILGMLLIVFALKKSKKHCINNNNINRLQWFSKRTPFLFPIILGLATGLNLCSPFLLAFTQATETGSLLYSLYFFFRDTLEDYRAVLVEGDLGDLPLWVTEFGWPSVDGLGMVDTTGWEYAREVSETQQADYLVQGFQTGHALEWTGPMILWNLNIATIWGGQRPESAYSLFRPDGSFRPAWLAVRVAEP